MEVFSSWGNEKSAEKPVVAVRSSVQDWRPLLKEKDLCLEFRFIGRELEINAFLHVRSTIPRVIDILTVPSERKKWDIRMQEMLNIPLNGGFIFIYANERKLYEFHSLVKILQSQTQGTVEFNTLCYEFKRQNTVFGKFTSVYNASVIEETEEENKGLEEFDPQGNKFHKLKVTWNSHFCEASFELIRGDIFQEADILRKSFQLMINLAEFRDQETAEGIQNENNLLETFERKKLTKTFSLGNFDFT